MTGDQLSDWERDYGSPYDHVARKREAVPVVDVIEMAGSLVDSGAMSLHNAAVLVMEHARLTYMAATSLVANWRTVRADYESGGEG